MSADRIWALVIPWRNRPGGVVGLRSLRRTRSEVIDHAVCEYGSRFATGTTDRIRLFRLEEKAARWPVNVNARRAAWAAMRQDGYRVTRVVLVEVK